jgi:hypothetical protein
MRYFTVIRDKDGKPIGIVRNRHLETVNKETAEDAPVIEKKQGKSIKEAVDEYKREKYGHPGILERLRQRQQEKTRLMDEKRKIYRDEFNKQSLQALKYKARQDAYGQYGYAISSKGKISKNQQKKKSDNFSWLNTVGSDIINIFGNTPQKKSNTPQKKSHGSNKKKQIQSSDPFDIGDMFDFDVF